ncbi:hypothetical protein HPB52_005824 [Rhipicephalus sanguineus]|uniref:Fatty acyl-CoA reductase n=1 Tax=Rhipicephalus sanguineus TaxID=34632 RepID=A0A9D4Q561_RHISA|nr:hypothetical protein HPB52_005824 [Rhipicephalus sanguineus]
MSSDMSSPRRPGMLEFFSGKNVLLTGSTGFLGKVLLEKILRSCPDVGSIYLIVRGKRGLRADDRIADILKMQLFQRLRQERPQAFQKIVVLEGDLTLPDLGLKPKDRQLLVDTVNVVIHSAATVKFDEPINWLDSETLESCQSKLLGAMPNTYTFTKGLAETLVQRECKGYPVAIVRPSIVVCSWKEPFPGWVDNFNGPTGLIVAVATGVLKSVYTDPDMETDFVPVDVVVNCILASAWNVAVTRPSDVRVVQCACSGRSPQLRWRDMKTIQESLMTELCFKSAIRYPDVHLRRNIVVHRTSMFLQHYVPACIGDAVLACVGKKQWLVKTYYKLELLLEALAYFTTHQWKFETNNMMAIYNDLSEEEKKIFNFDVSTLEWRPFFYHYALGARDILLKEDHSKVKSRNFQRLYVVKQATNVLFALAAWKLLDMGPTLWRLWEYLTDTVAPTFTG